MTRREGRLRLLSYAGLLILLIFTTAVRLRLAGVPLERDEGEYAYAGQLILQGVPPFKAAYNMKFPGVYAAYALIFEILGQTGEAVHYGTALVNGFSVVCVFFLARRLGIGRGLVSAITFGTLTLDPWSLGLAGHATHFVVAVALPGMLLLTGLHGGRISIIRCISAGMCFGLAMLMKQPGALFLPMGILLAWLGLPGLRNASFGNTIARILLIICGFIIPPALCIAILWRVGLLERFWFWTVTYASSYANQISFRDIPQMIVPVIRQILQNSMPLWTLGAAGLVGGFLYRDQWKLAIFVLSSMLLAFAAVSVGFYFRPHYFIMLIPSVALAVGLVAKTAVRILGRTARRRALLAAVLCMALVAPLQFNAWLWFTASPSEVIRTLYSGNPFVESLAIAEYIRSHTSSGNQVAVLGSEPEIYFESNRRAATGYLYTYSLMEAQPHALQMQREMAAEIERSDPAIVVQVHSNLSWGRTDRSESYIYQWAEQYLANAKIVGVVDIRPDTTYYFWDADVQKPAARQAIHSDMCIILVYQRHSLK